MPKVRVHNFSMSLDGYTSGPNQSLAEPLGVGGEQLHQWMLKTRYWREMVGEAGGTEGTDNDFMARFFEGIGATIMGRNMFGPVRGEWGAAEWKGWWGDNPPYHHPVFVLTHHAHEPIEMDGGTTFHFVTEGIDVALDRARAAAGDKDISLPGGASTMRQYLARRLVDEMHIAVAPVLLGGGERLFEGDYMGYEIVERVCSSEVTHIVLRRRP